MNSITKHNREVVEMSKINPVNQKQQTIVCSYRYLKYVSGCTIYLSESSFDICTLNLLTVKILCFICVLFPLYFQMTRWRVKFLLNYLGFADTSTFF